ncbi:MAG TPA: redoxin family protein, partial [Dongiaceae bacterium]|nr:redoxin family protein [Dongiaceae bacterium]
MSIKVGDRIPNVSLKYMDKDGMQTVSTDDLFKGKKVVLFALPGAFTPTCSAKHLPGFVNHFDQIK